MASSDEAGPSKNRNQINEAAPANSVRELNRTFPRIDNLEHFPLQVLINIFTNCDDISLQNLAEKCNRFDGIARTVFRQRYAADYFVIDGETNAQREMYSALFERFARHANIRAIAVKRNLNIDADHWMAQFVRRHINHLEKISFDECSFRNANEFLAQYLNITHLSLRHIHNPPDLHIQLPNFRHLTKLELSRIRDDIPFNTIDRIIAINPALESLVIRHINISQFDELIAIIANHLTNLRELALIVGNSGTMTPLSYAIMDRFADSLQHLESLGLTIEENHESDLPVTPSIELLRRVGRACKQLKHLELNVPNIANIRAELIQTISRFQRIESFALETRSYDNDTVESMIEHLPNVRQLYIKFDRPNSYVNNLLWLPRYPLIERITIAIDNFHFTEATSSFIGNQRYFMELHRIIQNRRVQIEFEENSQVIGRITKDEIVWRNKLMYWTVPTPPKIVSNMKLLDLAEVVPKAKLPNAFDLILDYLDVRSRNSLAMACKKSIRLVNQHAEKRLREQASFTITNEFSYENEPPPIVARYVSKLNVYNFDWNVRSLTLVDLIKRYYRNVKKLCIMYDRFDRQCIWLFPEVRHFVCISLNTYSALNEIYSKCPELEILECKNVIYKQWCYGSVPFPNLKKFIFKYSDDAILAMIRKQFQNTNTELVPIA